MGQSVTARHIEAALRAIPYAYGGQKWSLATLAKGADKAVIEAGITTREGVAVFVSQCMVESAYFRTTTEYGGSSASYAPYYGRGFIQCTFRSNYANFGRWCAARGLVSDANYFVNVPSRLADEKWAWLTAVWYLSTHRHNLIARANKGQIWRVGMGVHAGDAFADRRGYPWSSVGRNRIKHTTAAYKALLAAGVRAPDSGPWRYRMPKGVSFSVEDVQRAADVAADGVYGPGTRKAVRRLQKSLGLAADGMWGPATEKAYKASQKSGGSKEESKKEPEKKPEKKPEDDPNLWTPTGDLSTRQVQRIVGADVDGIYGAGTKRKVRQYQKRLGGITADGKWGPGTEDRRNELAPKVDGAFGPATISALQRFLDVEVDGAFGPDTKKAMQRWLDVKADGKVGPRTVRALQDKVGAKVDGDWGSSTTRSLQKFLRRY